MTALRTGCPGSDIRGRLRGDRSIPTAAHPPGEHQHLAAVDGHRIPRGQLTSAAGLDRPVHHHIPPLDALLGFAAGAHEALPFEELIQFHRPGASEER